MPRFIPAIFGRAKKKDSFPSRWTHIVIHHSLTKDQKVVDWPAIRRYHKEELGYIDVGYPFGIEGIYRQGFGTVYEILVGRQLNQTGAHCKQAGMNRKGIGICMIGNFDVVPPPDDQLEKLISLVRALMSVFKIPKKNVKRHSDFAPYKTCPGKAFPWDKFKALI